MVLPCGTTRNDLSLGSPVADIVAFSGGDALVSENGFVDDAGTLPDFVSPKSTISGLYQFVGNLALYFS